MESYPKISICRGVRILKGAEPAGNLDECRWLQDSIERPWGRGDHSNYVASVIPRGFAAYARIFHPPYDTFRQRESTWAEAAGHYGRKFHSQMQWAALAKQSGEGQSRFVEPDKGHLSERQAMALVNILSSCTGTADECNFAVWDGWGLLVSEQWPGAPRLHLPGRSYILLTGPIESALMSVTPKFQQSASLWWPRDRAWCVATEIDMMWTYVGGSRTCIEKLLADKELEALESSPDHRADINGDLINT